MIKEEKIFNTFCKVFQNFLDYLFTPFTPWYDNYLTQNDKDIENIMYLLVANINLPLTG